VFELSLEILLSYAQVSGDHSENSMNQIGRGASAAQFHTTLWTEVLSAGDQSSPDSNAALARLCQTYWVPVYAFVRKRGNPPDEAADLTQSFFAKFLAMNYVARAERERGRFRSFLMTSVANFLHDQHDRAGAVKRGSGHSPFSLDVDQAEKEFIEESILTQSPAHAFEKRWATALLDNTMQRLAAEQKENVRPDLFEHLQRHLWGDSDSVPYAQLAETLGLSAVNLRVSMHRLRQRYREILREQISHTVATPAEIEDEIRYLMTVVAR
jgi:RNA polymerase sigma factor (sigma-70 family)